ncbi:spore coat protein [Brevibacillus sp. GCM10020057]|uniref:spore coat protein n=1 Tax=Brevibacillus sp. GCM10020057 TaxID=3317327 RepID=UPI0036362348
MKSHPYGAHEVIELHEVLNGAIDAITTAHLYVPFIRDPELAQLVHHQLQFMQGEYNTLVYTVQGLGAGELLPYRSNQPIPYTGQMAGQTVQTGQPMQASQPHPYASQIHDRDVASALLGIHKAGAKTKMAAALEAAHPQIRELLLQGAVNCAHQAHELWGYMQRKGYYTWAVMPEATNAELLRGYQPLRSEPEQPVSPQAAPVQAGSEQSTIPSQLLRESANGARVAPVVEPPMTPVSANPVFSPPSYRHDVHGAAEDTAMTTDIVQTTGVEATDALYQQADGRQPRSRKKNTISDTLLGQ